jgi:hypothetical protein
MPKNAYVIQAEDGTESLSEVITSRGTNWRSQRQDFFKSKAREMIQRVADEELHLLSALNRQDVAGFLVLDESFLDKLKQKFAPYVRHQIDLSDTKHLEPPTPGYGRYCGPSWSLEFDAACDAIGNIVAAETGAVYCVPEIGSPEASIGRMTILITEYAESNAAIQQQ